MTWLTDVAATRRVAIAGHAGDLVTDDHLLAQAELVVTGLESHGDRPSRVG